jgi:hypothetical protein
MTERWFRSLSRKYLNGLFLCPAFPQEHLDAHGELHQE